MVKIVSDTSTMYSSVQAEAAGFAVSPLAVTINNETYRELNEINADRFVEIINQGHMPRSSQPSIGDVLALYDSLEGCDVLNIAMADGLSGTYSTAVTAAQSATKANRIEVINSTTLCGPHRYIVEKAVQLANKGLTLDKVKAQVEEMCRHQVSFLLPSDFDYLRRGGRLSPLVSYVGKAIRLAPVLTQSPNGRQLVMSAVKRSFKQAVAHVARELQQLGADKGWRIYVTHGAAPGMADTAVRILRETFAEARIEVYLLTPAFITQGGPGCVAIQAVQEVDA